MIIAMQMNTKIKISQNPNWIPEAHRSCILLTGKVLSHKINPNATYCTYTGLCVQLTSFLIPLFKELSCYQLSNLQREKTDKFTNDLWPKAEVLIWTFNKLAAGARERARQKENNRKYEQRHLTGNSRILLLTFPKKSILLFKLAFHNCQHHY